VCSTGNIGHLLFLLMFSWRLSDFRCFSWKNHGPSHCFESRYMKTLWMYFFFRDYEIYIFFRFLLLWNVNPANESGPSVQVYELCLCSVRFAAFVTTLTFLYGVFDVKIDRTGPLWSCVHLLACVRVCQNLSGWRARLENEWGKNNISEVECSLCTVSVK
jgi:hypothetical protein